MQPGWWRHVHRVHLSLAGLLSQASELEARGIDGPMPGGCVRALLLKPFGEQSEPEDPFPIFPGALSLGVVHTTGCGSQPGIRDL